MAAAPASDAGPCGATPAQAPTRIRVTSSGAEREALVEVPASYAGAPAPVILAFHGFMMTPEQLRDWSELTAAAHERGYVVVYPRGAGDPPGFNGGLCCGQSVVDEVDDVAFVKDLLRELPREVCIDPTRVFAVGFSAGGFFAQRLACEIPRALAAVASVAGVLGVERCAPEVPIPLLLVHGKTDDTVPVGGSKEYGFESLATTLRRWAKANSCGKPSPSKELAGCTAYAGCQVGGGLFACVVDDVGHTWPGGRFPPKAGRVHYPPAGSFPTTATILSFFASAEGRSR